MPENVDCLTRWKVNEPSLSFRVSFIHLCVAEAKNQITTDLFLKKDEWAPAVMREFGNSMDSERAQKSVRYMARVNLATFTIAIWTGTDLRQILAEFFPYVIPQNYEYVNKLLRTFLEISSWVAANECSARLNEDAHDDEAVYIDDILQDIFQDNLKSLDLSDEDPALTTLEAMFTEKYNSVGYLLVYNTGVILLKD